MGRGRVIGGLAVAVLVTLGCAVRTAVPAPPAEPASDPASASAAPVPGDVAPNEADNNGWKQRHELTDAERAQAQRAADRIRPALQRLPEPGPEPVRQALLWLGYAAGDVTVERMHDGSPGAAFGVRVGPRACVVGEVTPSRVRADVAGTAAEFGCLEPFTH